MTTNTYLVKKILNDHIAITILVTLTATLSMVINGLVIGQMLGHEELTAYGLSNPVILILAAIAGIFSNGGSIVCARHIGAGDMEKVARNFSITMFYSALCGAVFTVVFFFGAGMYTSAMGLSGNIGESTTEFVRVVALTGIPLLLQQNLMLFLRMDGNQRLSLIAMVVSVFVNAAFAVWSAKCTDMGMYGIGLSMLLSNLAGMAVCLLHFRRKKRMLRFAMPRNVRSELSEICKAGLPTAINRGSQTLKNLALNSYLLAFGGTVAVLALSVQTNVYQFLIAIGTGYGIMIAMMCGFFMSEKDKRALEDSLKVCLISGFIVSLIAGIILFVFADQIAAMFIDKGGDVQMASDCLRFFALSQPTSTVCLIFLYMYQAMGDIVITTTISLTRGVGYVVLVSVLLAPIVGLSGVWISFFLADILSMLTIIAVIYVKKRRIPRKLSDFILVPEEKYKCDDICNISITNDMNEVMGLADRMETYFDGRDIDKDKIHRLSLCVEEMAGNIVKHAFKDGKKHFIDIRVFVESEDIVMRIRDDGVNFNPIVENSEEHYGIRTVRAAAKSIDYRRNFNLNNLVVIV